MHSQDYSRDSPSLVGQPGWRRSHSTGVQLASGQAQWFTSPCALGPVLTEAAYLYYHETNSQSKLSEPMAITSTTIKSIHILNCLLK
ncbi:hypothetical protein TNCT_40251 [Trichonephila clavata]|uniref:Uncharacterized protein n=1 Tax=Trichonephila clavata TaxID=2740835 RepID=A0A8X6F9W4_TRICU|nr:hypothetical protein TNCT_40251 [Trichonephila clavata]